MTLSELVRHPRAIQLGLRIGPRLPPGLVDRLASGLASLLTRLEPAVARIVKDNLRQVLGPEASRRDVDRTTQRVFYHFVRGYYDLFRAMRLPGKEMLARVHVPEGTIDRLWAAQAEGRAVVLVLVHVGNFDLLGQVLASRLPRVQAITLPDPVPGFVSLNEIRQRAGLDITPLSVASLRQGLRTLREGGVLVIGGDRPVSDLDQEVPFFGRPARVPSAHVRLALKTDALVAAICCYWDQALGSYCLHAEPTLEMIRTGDEKEEIALNMRRVLDSLENVIRRSPDQWFMFVPVWPEAGRA